MGKKLSSEMVRASKTDIVPVLHTEKWNGNCGYRYTITLSTIRVRNSAYIIYEK